MAGRTVATARSARGTLWWARLVCLSAFGPYITGSARTEQIAVFGSLAVILVAGWRLIFNARSCAPLPFLILWTSLLAVVLIGTVTRPPDLGFYGAQLASHGISAILLPIAPMMVTWYWTLRVESADLISAIAPIVVGAMVLNTTIALAQMVTGRVAVFGFLPQFWDAPGSLGSVAINSAENGRYTGIFNQPAEAGIAYGIALFCLIYLGQSGIRWRGYILAGCAIVLVTGGVLTVSKMFLLGSLPLGVLMVLRNRRSRVRLAIWTAVAAAVGWLAARSKLLPPWPAGSAMLRSLIDPSGSLVTAYSAGRYSTGGTLGPVVADVLRSSPLYGFGAGGLAVPYDSLWVEVLVVAGVAGVVLAIAVLFMLGFRWALLRATMGRQEWSLAGAVLVLAAGGSLGLASLTANRDATLVWLILGLVSATRPGQVTNRQAAIPSDLETHSSILDHDLDMN